jgi:hypothetical protein
MLPTKFRFIWPSGFIGEDFFRNQPIRNKNCLWWPCLLTDRNHFIFSSPLQSQRELFPSLGIRRPLTFHILIFSSETPQPNEVKLGRERFF